MFLHEHRIYTFVNSLAGSRISTGPVPVALVVFHVMIFIFSYKRRLIVMWYVQKQIIHTWFDCFILRVSLSWVRQHGKMYFNQQLVKITKLTSLGLYIINKYRWFPCYVLHSLIIWDVFIHLFAMEYIFVLLFCSLWPRQERVKRNHVHVPYYILYLV